MSARIVSTPDVRGGAPCVAGTRITAEEIVRWVGAGETAEDLRREYGLTPEQVQAALDYPAVRHDRRDGWERRRVQHETTCDVCDRTIPAETTALWSDRWEVLACSHHCADRTDRQEA